MCLEKKTLKTKKIGKPLSIGFNRMGNDSGNSGIHAEHDAIRKLLPLRRKRKKPINVTLLVVRISNRNKLQTSKPCINCLKIIKTLPQKLGYNIKHIYYSDDNVLVKTTISELEQEKPHITGFARWNKLEPRIKNG